MISKTMMSRPRVNFSLHVFGVVALLCGWHIVAVSMVFAQSSFRQGVTLESGKPTLLEGFGFAVASEGNAVVVGAPHAEGTRGQVGKAFLFDRETGKVLHTFLPSGPMGDDLFGMTVGLTEKYVIVGAPRGVGKGGLIAGMVAVFDRRSGTLIRHLASPNGLAKVFGHVVAIHDGWLAIGDPGASSRTHFDVGEVHIFDLDTGEWRKSFVSPDTPRGSADGFGQSLAFIGSLLAVGAPLAGTDPLDHGKVYLFDVSTGQLVRTLESPHPQTKEYFGWSLASDDRYMVVGALGYNEGTATAAGAAYLFDREGRMLKSHHASLPQKDGHFGESVAMLQDLYAVGSPGDDENGVDAGAVYLFNTSSHQLEVVIPNPATTTGVADLFGFSLYGNKNHLLVGSPYADLAAMPDAGRVYQFYFDRILTQLNSNNFLTPMP